MSIQAFKSMFYGVGVFVTGKTIVEIGHKFFDYSLKPTCVIESLIGRLFGEISTFASTDYCSHNTNRYQYSTSFVDVMLVGSIALSLLSIAKRSLFKHPIKTVFDLTSFHALAEFSEEKWRILYSNVPWDKKDECLIILLREIETKALSKEISFIRTELDNINGSNNSLVACKRAWQAAGRSTRDKLISALAESLPVDYLHCDRREQSVKWFNVNPIFYKGCAKWIFAQLEKETPSCPIPYLTSRVERAFFEYYYFLQMCELMRDEPR